VTTIKKKKDLSWINVYRKESTAKNQTLIS